MASVNKPTDVKVKEADINRKLQVYGIFSAFSMGKVPSNEQIDIALNSFLATDALSNPPAKLSAEGKALIADVREVVQQAKRLLLSKNEGNLLQDFIYQTTQFDAAAIDTPNAPVSKETAQQHGNQALEGLRTLGTLLITNGQFRKLLNDSTLLLRDMAGDAATNAASRVRPSDEQLNQIDAPAADNTWHDAPDFSKENMQKQLQGVYKGNPSEAKEDAKDVAAAGIKAANPSTSGVNTEAGASAAQSKLNEKVSPEQQEKTKQQLQETKETAKVTAEEYRRRTREYLSKKVPEERREQTIWRLKKIVLECQQHPDYDQAITTLLDLAEEYGNHTKAMTAGATGTVQQGRGALAQAEADLKTLIERFANGTSSDDLWSALNMLYEDADKDPELKGWFTDCDRYIRKLLKQQGYILEDASTDEYNRLYDRGNYLLRDKYKAHTDRLLDEIKFLANQFEEDRQNKVFGQTLQKLFNDLGNDSNGQPTFKPHLVKDLTEVILPAVFESIAYIPIPRIEYTDSQIDAVVENLVLESDNFMPNVFELSSDNYWRWGRKKITNVNKNSIDVKVSGIQLDLRDVSYYLKRKEGFPSITDEGVVNIFLGGEGFSFRMKLSTADKNDKQNFFKVEKVDVDVKNLKINLVKSKHKALFGMFKPLLLRVMKPVVQKVAEKQLKEQFTQWDRIMYQVKLEADRALEEAANDPENAPNVYNRYVTAFQKKVLQGKKQVEEAVADKKVNMAITQEDSIFPQIKLPGGISSKATEYKELARKGEKWESPVFSIGDAAKSTDIPRAPDVVRKPHTTAGASGSILTNGANGGAISSTHPATSTAAY